VLLRAWHAGDGTALDRLTPLVYDELRRRARYDLRDERRRDTLRPTALIHEVYLRMVRLPQMDCRDRAQLFALPG
jgi:hypothetical protein